MDIIIGGHSHTLMSEPCEVAGIPIVQAAIGTDQIGRFDITVDVDNNRFDSYTWQCIPITSETCPRDEALEEAINEYKDVTDEKYGRVLTRFPRAYTHPRRNMETELGDLMADALREQLAVDLILLGSGSIRKPELGPIVTLKDFIEIFPFNSPVFAMRFTGEQLRRAVRFMLREDAFVDSDHCEWYQFSRGFFCEYDRPSRSILSMRVNGKEVADGDLFTVGLQKFHYLNLETSLGLQLDEVKKNGPTFEVATKAADVLQEFFSSRDHFEINGEKRLVIHE